MLINTRRVSGRRSLRFEDLNEALADAKRVSSQPVKTLGNWSVGEILDHLANSVHESFAGSAPPAPWLARKILAPLLKRPMLKNGLPAGFRLGKGMEGFLPRPEVPADRALDALHDAYSRLKNESPQKPHAFFGNLTHDEWITLHLRHAELHLSFVVPEFG